MVHTLPDGQKQSYRNSSNSANSQTKKNHLEAHDGGYSHRGINHFHIDFCSHSNFWHRDDHIYSWRCMMGPGMYDGIFTGIVIFGIIIGLIFAGLIWLAVWLFSNISIDWVG